MNDPDRTDRTVTVTATARYGGVYADITLEQPVAYVADDVFVTSALALRAGAVLAHAVNGEPIPGLDAVRESPTEDAVDAAIPDEDETPTMSTNCRCVPVSPCTCTRQPSHADALRSLALAEHEVDRLRRALTRIGDSARPARQTPDGYARGVLNGGPA